jgi:hypothetical protein
MDSWTPKQLKCMQLGGNHSLSEFLSSYDLMSEPMDVRYQTKAAEYYRKKLRSFCNDEEFTEEKPDYEEGRLPIEYRIKSQEEIKDAINGGPRDKSSAQGMDKAKEVFGSFWDGTKKVGATGLGYAQFGAKKIGDKYEESGLSDKVSSGARTVGTKSMEYGGIAYNKTKDGINSIATNEKVVEISSTVWGGAKSGATSVWGFFSKAINGQPASNDISDQADLADLAEANDAPGAQYAPKPNPHTDT